METDKKIDTQALDPVKADPSLKRHMIAIVLGGLNPSDHTDQLDFPKMVAISGENFPSESS